MYRTTLTVACVAAMLVTGVMTGVASAQGLDVVWDGGDGEWIDANWNGGSEALALIGQDDGSDGSSDINGGTRIIIGSAATVAYDENGTIGDFRVLQGSDLVIQGGATWTQNTKTTWSENLWTEMDLSNLVLDNGTFSRAGFVPGEGGGALIFGSWKGDDNFGNPSTPPPEVINIPITNGGGIENEGQLWFGSWGSAPEGIIVAMTINDGSLDLTGGDVPGVGDEADADLVFTLLDTTAPDFSINFTGPGSITVDKSGIIAPVGTTDPGTGDVTWSNLSPITYEELWDLGILQANGLSGPDGETFADSFDVTGSLGADDYMLTAISDPDYDLGDVNQDGEVNGLDVDPFVDRVTTGDFQAEADMNGDGAVNGLDVDPFVAAVVGGGVQAVPEPATLALAGMGLLGLLWFGRKRR
jgi:hypothetical protein